MIEFNSRKENLLQTQHLYLPEVPMVCQFSFKRKKNKNSVLFFMICVQFFISIYLFFMRYLHKSPANKNKQGDESKMNNENDENI